MLALAAASFAVWYLRWQSQHSVAFWGRDVAALMAHASQVELLRLSPADDAQPDSAAEPAERLTIGGREFVVVERRDAADARGLINVRRGLLADATFRWPESSDPPVAQWEYALRFTEGSDEATVVFAFSPPLAMLVGEERAVSTEPVAEGLEAFFVDAFH